MSLPKYIKKPILAAFHKSVKLNLALNGHVYRYVFVLAHMRSGSTLFSHLLSSHPDFTGAGETHTTYRTPADFTQLILKTCEILHRLRLRETHVVDQINHDWLLEDEVLLSELVYKCVILVREPEATLKSMMGLFNWPESTALKAYVDRLRSLARYGGILRERALLVDYDGLIDQTDETLSAITRFFGVDPPFTASYMTHKATGRVGDPSGNIALGRIVRTLEHQNVLSTEVVTEAFLAFRRCQHELLSVGVPCARSPLT